ncbi:hypothetical protein W97_03738 [Coniosporium apollinis CBS 100218]|uniref:Uncharacterized protein n=1 Tax=Coniosporium apollinis (strain CBS 100218) TaxID=1168221 RepID=R7YRG5_CONA1|nr:uncharacterized protein W97_03738 [Coniosporium apollinis CBS 100218]EON64505.1 hypothetical protein W97_03738 [Coniosporium apollinis CBS 100218]
MSLNGLSENVFLLEKFTKTPDIPHDNPIPARLLQCHPLRTLKLEHEQSIVSALSFLSSYTDDCYKVSAICVEEMPDGRGLFISIAANSGELRKMKAGLERLAKILMDEAKDGS